MVQDKVLGGHIGSRERDEGHAGWAPGNLSGKIWSKARSI
jgi:hypothetical protein